MDYAENFLPLVRKNYERDGIIHTVAAVLCTKHPKTREPFPNGEVAAVFIPMGEFPNKDIFATMVRGVAQNGEARAVVLISETWMGESPEALKWYEEHGTLEGAPGVSEAVMVSEERQGSYATYRAYITRDSDGEGYLGDFTKLDTDKTHSSGRFIGFLNPQV